MWNLCCTEHLTARTFFSVLASPCQIVSLRSVVSSLLTCTTRACGSRYERGVLRDIMSLLGVPILSSFCSTPPPSWTPSPETLTGIRPTPCVWPVSEDFDHLPQRFSKQQPAFGSKHCSHVVDTGELVRGNDSFAGSLFSTVDLVRGNSSVASVEESVLRGKRDPDSTSART